MTDSDAEKEISPGDFQAHAEYFRTGESKNLIVSIDFRTRIGQVFQDIYPQETINRLLAGGFNPYIIGYAHPEDQADLPAIQKRLSALQQNSPRPLKIAYEIPPAQLQYIRDFLDDEKESNRTGSTRGVIPKTPSFEEYRQRLVRNLAGQLALWLLENGFDLVPIEHKDVQNWIEHDKRLFPVEEDFFGEREPVEREFYTSIRRDVNGLAVLEKERPDVICVGTLHALKYDLLLKRNGSRSYYFLEKPLDLEAIFRSEQAVHNRYRLGN